MRTRLLPLSFCVLAIGCVTAGDAPGPPGYLGPTPSAPASAPQCLAQAPSACDGALATTLDEPSRQGAILWAQAAAGSSARSAGVPKVAVYADGTLERTPILRNADFFVTPPRGVVRARLSASALAALRVDLDAASSLDAHAFFAPDASGASDPEAVVLETATGRSCFRGLADPSSVCTPPALTRLNADAVALLDASETLWREARAGTVSLAGEAAVRGTWPLSDGLAQEGENALTTEQWSRVGALGLYRLTSGDVADVSDAQPTASGVSVYVTRREAVTVDASLDDLAAALLDDVGGYASSRGVWLGVPLDESRFPAFKNHEIAVVRGRAYWLVAIEHFDLRADGALESFRAAAPWRAPPRSRP
jgi:hypothetical protein